KGRSLFAGGSPFVQAMLCGTIANSVSEPYLRSTRALTTQKDTNMSEQLDSRPTVVLDEHITYLNEWREAGEMNLHHASGYLQDGFGLSPSDAEEVLRYWLQATGTVVATAEDLNYATVWEEAKELLTALQTRLKTMRS